MEVKVLQLDLRFSRVEVTLPRFPVRARGGKESVVQNCSKMGIATVAR